jgi:hypothetical protein
MKQIQKQMDLPGASLAEWLSRYATHPEDMNDIDRKLLALFDEYVQLMEAIEYWGVEPQSDEESFSQVLASKELEIMKMMEIIGATQNEFPVLRAVK